MKKNVSNSLPATKDLVKVLEKMGEKLYEERERQELTSPEGCRKWITFTFQRILWASEMEGAVIKYRKMKIAQRTTGPLGEDDYVTSDETEDYVRRLTKVSPKKTPKRLKQQSLMSKALEAEKRLTEEDMETWNQVATSIQSDGVHLFRGMYMRLVKDGITIPKPFLPTRELMEYYLRRKRKSTRQLLPK